MKRIAFTTLVFLSVSGFSGCGNSSSTEIADSSESTGSSIAVVPTGSSPAPAAQESLTSKIEKSKRQMQEQLTRSKKTPQIATVIVKGVRGDTDDAARFLYGIISRESGKITQQDRERAREQTNQNRQQAEAEARQKFLEGTGGLLYEYKLAETQYGWSYTWHAGTENGTFAYVVHPVPDLNAFGQGLARLGQVATTDATARQVVINANIPTPIPDLAVEAASSAYGSTGYALIEIREARGNEEDVQYYLEQQLKQLKGIPEKPLTVGYLKRLSNDGYRFLVSPVKPELTEIAAQISLGEVVASVDVARTIFVRATLPSEIPKKPSREELWALEAEERRNRPTVWDEEPKPGEAVADWAIRILKTGTWTAQRAMWTYLATADVDDARREEVMTTIVESLEKNSSLQDNDQFTEAVKRWKTPAAEELVIAKLQDKAYFSRRKALIQILEAYESENAARAIATCLTDIHSKDQAFASLKRMGLAAEPVFIDFLKDTNSQARLESAQLLGQFGRERSLEALEKALKTERVREVKAAIRFAIERIEGRLAEQTANV